MASSEQEKSIADAQKLLYDEGMKIRREVLGDAYVSANAPSTPSPFLSSAQEFVTAHAWGSIWTRPGLTKAQRSLVVLSIVAATGHPKELAAHALGALRNGVKEEEIREVLIHVMGYCGFPRGLEGFRAVGEVIEKWNKESPDTNEA